LLEDDEGSAKGIEMKSGVNIEGAGRNITVIQSRGIKDRSFGTVMMKDNSELRNLTVENIGGGKFTVPIYIEGSEGSNNRIADIDVKAHGGEDCRGIYSGHGNLILENVSIETHCSKWSTGIFSNLADGMFHNIRISSLTSATEVDAANAIRVNGGIVEIRDSLLRANATGDGAARGVYAQNDDESMGQHAKLSVINTTVEAHANTGRAVSALTLVGHSTGGQESNYHNCILRAGGGDEPFALRTTPDWHAEDGPVSPTNIDVVGSQVISEGPIVRVEDISHTRFVSSLLKGLSFSISAGEVDCSATTDENYVFYSNTCP
jgi:hypothetical protein